LRETHEEHGERWRAPGPTWTGTDRAGRRTWGVPPSEAPAFPGPAPRGPATRGPAPCGALVPTGCVLRHHRAGGRNVPSGAAGPSPSRASRAQSGSWTRHGLEAAPEGRRLARRDGATDARGVLFETSRSDRTPSVVPAAAPPWQGRLHTVRDDVPAGSRPGCRSRSPSRILPHRGSNSHIFLNNYRPPCRPATFSTAHRTGGILPWRLKQYLSMTAFSLSRILTGDTMWQVTRRSTCLSPQCSVQ